ncbi:MAG: amino acid adenylation domain-containing protein [Leptospiraceae bacterium]|nr:amino acid adenylation domain-containing protein [Leptospiraceae bacterium]
MKSQEPRESKSKESKSNKMKANKRLFAFILFDSFLEEFQKIVKEFPNSIAISSESEKISYYELDLRVTQISCHFYEAGIREGDVVALWMEKSLEYIVYVLAIWRLGAAFLPLDAKTPKARVDWICRDAKVRLLVTGSSRMVRLRSPTDMKLHPLTDMKFRLLELPNMVRHTSSEADTHWKLRSPDDLKLHSLELPTIKSDVAYIIYTSGSTGNPKGVVLTHEGIVNFLEKQIEVFQVSPKSKILQYLSIGFDASISEIGITLLSGAEIRIEKEENLKSIDRLIEILERERITHICLPPSLLPILPIEKIPITLETIVIGGEVCPVTTVREWTRKFRIVNVYGPTEATVCSSLVVCEPNWNKPLIGNPIPFRGFHILDEDLSEVGEGESGELYLSGVGLAREYLNLPELTDEKFILLNGIRMYKTGDRVLKHSSEEIEFLGRMDRQFKLRGNLIEPSEVERVLAAFPGISFAYVMKRIYRREVLVAYLKWNYNDSVDTPCHPEEQFPNLQLEGYDDPKKNFIQKIKQHISTLLPKWMIPERFVFLEKVPLNANEKLDVNALPELEMTRPSYLPPFKNPESEKEIKLCEIFERILGIHLIGIEDDFFSLGGDSISMISLLTECSLIGITLSPEAFIQNPTVAGILKLESVDKSHFSSVRFLNKEAELGTEILSAIQNIPLTTNRFSNILLTGATGFLGSRILYELTLNFEAEIYCIVRNISTRDPRKLLEEIYSKQGIQIEDWTKIHFLEGDISKPCLGLSKFHWEFLASKVDTVFHFAAEVNLVKPYNQLKPANIDSTREILRFCLTLTRKYLQYASTLSVFVSSDDSRDTFFEYDKLDTMQEVYGGYAQSKWVSEKILQNALEIGMDSIFIYRFGLITGDSKTGFSKQDDFFTEFLKSLVNLKVLPDFETQDIQVDITPLDYAAKVCIAISARTESYSKISTFHIANPIPLKLSELKLILQSFGIEISEVSKEGFIEKCKSNELENSYFYLSLSRLLLEKDAFTLIRPLDLFQATGIRFDFTNSNRILFDQTITIPYPDKNLLEKYLQFLVNFKL